MTVLNGGPLDGDTRDLSQVCRATAFAIWCPFPWQQFPHFASADYDRHGDYIKTECHSAEDGTEVHHPGEEWPDGPRDVLGALGALPS